MRSYITFAAIIIYTIIVGTAIIIAGIFDKTGRIYDHIIRLWARAILITAGIKVKIEGLENLDKNKSYVFMSNHLSHLDAVVLIDKLPFRLRFFAKKELLKIPIFGQALYMARHIIIDRKDVESAKKSIEKSKDMIVRYGLSVLVFPEGTRSITGKLGQFKKGGFVLAVQMGIPIVPVAVKGSLALLPSHTLLVKSGVILVKVGKPVSVDGYTPETKQPIIDKVRSEIESLIF